MKKQISDKRLIRHVLQAKGVSPFRQAAHVCSLWCDSPSLCLKSFLEQADDCFMSFLRKDKDGCLGFDNDRLLLLVDADELRKIIVKHVIATSRDKDVVARAEQYLTGYETKDAEFIAELHDKRYQVPGGADFVWLYGTDRIVHPRENASLISKHLLRDGSRLSHILKDTVLPHIEKALKEEHAYTRKNYPELYCSLMEKGLIAIDKAVSGTVTSVNKLTNSVIG